MPYLAHFGLKDHPFSLTPNTERYFPTSGKTQVLQSLEYGIHRSAGIMKVVGDVGTGKTLLCRLLLRRLTAAQDGDATGIAYLNAPQAEGDALIALVCAEFGLPTGDRAAMLRDLNAFLLARHAAGAESVLVVDEAQALGPAGLETIRLLSNLETERAKLLQIVLFGQTELDALLARPELRQVNQRIAFSFDSGPLSRAEVGAYVKHCLRVSRQEGVAYDAFEPKAVAAIAQASGGVPRVINILCDKAMLIAYGDGARTVSRAHVRGAIADSPSLLPQALAVSAGGGGGGGAWSWAAGIAGFAAAMGLAAWLFGADRLGFAGATPQPADAVSVAPAADAAPVAPAADAAPVTPSAEAAAVAPSVDAAAEPAPAPVAPAPVAPAPVAPAPVVAAPVVAEQAPEAVPPSDTPALAPAAMQDPAPPESVSAVQDAPARVEPPVAEILARAVPLPTPKPPPRPVASSKPASSKPVAAAKPVASSKPVAAAPPPAKPAATADSKVQVRSVQVRTVVPVKPGAPVAARRTADGTWEWR